MMLSKKNIFEIAIITFFVVIGLWFRLSGISTNHSFWADESYVSSFSRDIIAGKRSLIAGINGVEYERFQIATVALSFKLFGISETSARLPSAIWGTVGIIFVYLLAKKFSNKWGGSLSAFLYSIFQLNLVYSTQAKPYAAIETIFIIVLYLTTILTQNNKKIHLHILIVLFGILASLYNPIGIISLIPYLFIVASLVSKKIKISKKYILPFILLLLFFVWTQKIYRFIPILFEPKYNWTTLARELFWRQYGLYTLPALFGFFMIKDKKLKVGIGVAVITLLYAWTFVQYSHNIRYLMPIFGLIITLFGVFWAKIGNIIFKKPMLICLSVAILIYAGGYKVVRKPAVYYTPNADFSADVQNADYKTFFSEFKSKYGNTNVPIFTDVVDSEIWYGWSLPKALFKIGNIPPYSENVFGLTVYPDKSYLEQEMSKNPKGFFVVEDWQSILPDDVKDYVKKNMTLELRVESMEVSPNEKWPLALYSWGMNKTAK